MNLARDYGMTRCIQSGVLGLLAVLVGCSLVGCGSGTSIIIDHDNPDGGVTINGTAWDGGEVEVPASDAIGIVVRKTNSSLYDLTVAEEKVEIKGSEAPDKFADLLKEYLLGLNKAISLLQTADDSKNQSRKPGENVPAGASGGPNKDTSKPDAVNGHGNETSTQTDHCANFRQALITIGCGLRTCLYGGSGSLVAVRDSIAAVVGALYRQQCGADICAANAAAWNALLPLVEKDEPCPRLKNRQCLDKLRADLRAALDTFAPVTPCSCPGEPNVNLPAMWDSLNVLVGHVYVMVDTLERVVATVRNMKPKDRIAHTIHAGVDPQTGRKITITIKPKELMGMGNLACCGPRNLTVNLVPKKSPLKPVTGLIAVFTPGATFTDYEVVDAGNGQTQIVAVKQVSTPIAYGLSLGLGVPTDRKGVAPDLWGVEGWLNPSDEIRQFGAGLFGMWWSIKLSLGLTWIKHDEVPDGDVGKPQSSSPTIGESYVKSNGWPLFYIGLAFASWPF